MKAVLGLTILIMLLTCVGFARVSSSFANRIEGHIFDEARAPVGDMYVELQNDVGSSLRTTRSTAGGRFSFEGLTTGVFRVKVLASGKNFLEQTQEVQFIQSVTGRNDDIKFVEFYLRVDRRGHRAPIKSPDAIFVQEIPETAKKLYQSGLAKLETDTPRGIEDLEKAIKIFPNYFDALSRLGIEYALWDQFDKSYPLLLRAIDINQRSFSSYYFLGYSFYKLNQIAAAIKAAEGCVVLMPAMAEGYVLLGTALRLDRQYSASETSLRKAISISKDNAQAHWQLALLLNRMDRNREAADELEIFLQLAPQDDADKKAAQELVRKLRSSKKG